MKGYGEWLQLSVFQCRLTRKQHASMLAMLDTLIHHDADQVLIIHLGSADAVKSSINSLGKTVEILERQAVII